MAIEYVQQRIGAQQKAGNPLGSEYTITNHSRKIQRRKHKNPEQSNQTCERNFGNGI